MSTVENVSLTIDGREVSVPKGTNVLEAARQLGIDISYFCYHPGLSIAACCRQCLVEIEGQPKLAPSCQVTVMPGMKVKSEQSPKALLARQQQLEFTLVNHPVDCPICDKAGECILQKLYFEWDAKPSRVIDEKVHKPKRVDLGPTIILDQERCILCTRCIRVCDEVAGQHQLEMANRGDREILTTAPGQALDNPYSLNTVDVCPVGALTSKDFRFTMRAWELFATPSVCNGCATGCNIEIHHRERRIYRLVPRPNPDVNKYWMCDEGRFTYKDVHQQRVATPFVGGLPASWERALGAAADALRPVLDDQRDGVGFVLSPSHSNEDNFVVAKLATEFLGLTRVYVLGKAAVPERADKILRDADVNANSAGVKALAPGAKDAAALEADLESGAVKALVILGDGPLSDRGIEKIRSLTASIAVAAHDRGIAAAARVMLPAGDWAEVDGTITNRQGRTQRMRSAFPPPGQALPAWDIGTRLARRLGAAFEYASARAVWKDLAAKGAPFSVDNGGTEWGRELPVLQLRFAGSRG